MKKKDLNGIWQLCYNGQTCTGTVPGSVYSFLLENKMMDDPFYRDNELSALALMENDFVFSKKFQMAEEFSICQKIYLACEGLDTLCEIQLNGHLIGKADNMHRTWEYDITDALTAGENTLEIYFPSPVKAIRELDAKDYVGGSEDAMRGFPQVRKAHCMFGWDWGPRLPDAGIWRNISLIGMESARITDIRVRQKHSDGVAIQVDTETEGLAHIEINLRDPDENEYPVIPGEWFDIPNPMLWWPNGLGSQPLYTIRVKAVVNGEVVDSVEKKIGLRTLTIKREKDEWGESFAHQVNGLCYFAMGADYIPEDNILSRITPARTRKLLENCIAANYNTIRVWGGGYYPDDYFFDICDELGLVVWQDFMFACATYRLTDDFEQNIRKELIDNIRRIRHHVCLGLWCGNNEMEFFQLQGAMSSDETTRADYIKMFEYIFPHILAEEDPDTFYWPSSPSSGGSFRAPDDPNCGDVHYWDVWHGNKPFTEYRKFYFRYVSEFGFQSFPALQTVESFTRPEDRNIFSRVMEMHQRNASANGRIMNYLSQTLRYPHSFSHLLYASQILQAEAIRYGVEHWRRNRGRCMGAIYWQLNDCWPVASWSSIDYFGRWKALHYKAKRFFAPIMISCMETGETSCRGSVVDEPSPVQTKAQLNIANETHNEVSGTVCWQLCDASSKVLQQQGEANITVPSFSTVWLTVLDFDGIDFLNAHLYYSFEMDGKIVSDGSVLFTAPKHYHFKNPNLRGTRNGNKLTIEADCYAKYVEIIPDNDAIFSDNYFDMEKGCREVTIMDGDFTSFTLRSIYEIQ